MNKTQLLDTSTGYGRSTTASIRSADLRQKKPGRSRWWINGLAKTAFSLAILTTGGLIFTSLGSVKPGAPPSIAELNVPTVEVATVQIHEKGITFDVNGVVFPTREIRIPSEVAGRVVYRSPNCHVGHTVKEGELLVKIDPEDFIIEIRRLESQIEQAEANLQESVAEMEATQRKIELAREELVIQEEELARIEILAQSNSITKSVKDSTKLTEIQARSTVQGLEDQLKTLAARRDALKASRELVERQLDKARLNLKRTSIYAPIDGLITQDPVEEGTYIQAGGVITQVQDISSMEIRCSLQMKEMHWLWQSDRQQDADDEQSAGIAQRWKIPETSVTVVYSMEGALCKWSGTLRYFDGGKVNEQTRMIPCRIHVDDPADVRVETLNGKELSPPVLMAGMFVTAEVHSRPSIKLLSLPESAIQPGGTVWVVRENRLQEVAVQIAQTEEQRVLVYATKESLVQGDKVVVSPIAAPVENTVVNVEESL